MGAFRGAVGAAAPRNRKNFCSGLSSLNSFLPQPCTYRGAETDGQGDHPSPSKSWVEVTEGVFIPQYLENVLQIYKENQ